MRLIFSLFSVAVILFTQPALAEPRSTVLAGGCFWCVESDFDKVEGVTSTVSGYSGGSVANPTYETYNKVSAKDTPHIEVVKVDYDDSVVSYEDILRYHFRHIDPTDGNGQFCDRGAGYRPAIFVKNDKEREVANKVRKDVAKALGQKVNVDILDGGKFYPAEDYHQNYYKKSATRYKFYRWNCGRDSRIEDVWRGKKL